MTAEVQIAPKDRHLRKVLLGFMAEAADVVAPRFIRNLSLDPMACLLGVTLHCMGHLGSACARSGVQLVSGDVCLVGADGRMETTPNAIFAFARLLMASTWQPPEGFPCTREQMETALEELLG